MNKIIVEAYILGAKYLIAFAVQTIPDAYDHLNYVTIKLNVHSLMMKNSAKKNHQFTCDKGAAPNRGVVEEIFCGLSEDENARIEYFSVLTSF